MDSLKCTIIVMAGVITTEPIQDTIRRWDFTQENLDNPPIYIDQSGAAMNYAMSLMNPARFNWVKFEWVWY